MNFKISTRASFLLGALVLIAPSTGAAPAVIVKRPVVLKSENVVQKAFAVAQKSSAISYVSATVTLTALGKTTDLPRVLIGKGSMKMEGDLLQGKLDLTFDSPAKVPPGKNQLLFNVSRTNRVGLQWLINDKPRNYVSLKAFDGQATSDALTAKINWNGANWLLTATLEHQTRKLVGPKKPGGRVVTLPSKEKKPMVIIAAPAKPSQKAVGRNFVVTGRFLATNTEDGVGGIFGNADDSVELSGNVIINGGIALSLSNRSVDAGTSLNLKEQRLSLRYDDPKIHYCEVNGSISDRDKASASDMLWNASQSIDLMNIMESKREFVIRGDRDSESGDLYIRVVDGGEIME